jgi:Zn-dependent protease with chaperone function
MNFFEQQDQARKSTRILVGLFGLSVGAMTGCIYLASIVTMGLTPLSGSGCRQASLPEPIAIIASRKSSSGSLGRSRSSRSSRSTSGFGSSSSGNRSDFGSSSSQLDPFGRRRSGYSSYDRRSGRYSNTPCTASGMVAKGWWHPQILFWVMLITTSVVGMASLYKINQLKGGGAVIAQELGGELLLPETADAQGQQLLNVVEEMAIAAGIPVPSVYLLNHEDQINAFAAGFDPKDAVLGVTRGSLEQLTRDELQGMIGHEFSHILNGDMQMNIKLMGILHGILFISIAGRVLFYTSDSRNNPTWGFGLALMGIGSMGLLGGRLIQGAVSRQRMFLADASAVQFTRNPNGIAGALDNLVKIGSCLRSPHAQASSHMFFGDAIGFDWAGDLFATHPSPFKRIEKIRGVNASDGASQLQTRQTNRSSTMVDVAEATTNGSTYNSSILVPAMIVQQVGTVTPEHYAHAQGLLAQLPESLRAALREPMGAIATLYSLFLDTQDPAIRDRQMQHLNQSLSEGQLAKILEHDVDVRLLDLRLRLPLVDLAIPALRQCSPDTLRSFLANVEALANADGEWTLSEFALFLVLQRRLDSSLFPHRETPIQYQALSQVWPDCLAVLAALASAGGGKVEAIAYAFRCGAFKLPGATPQSIPEAPPHWTLGTLPHHLERLRQAAPKLKQSVINACAHTVLLDNEVTVQESELLRAITITLDCPIPPFLNSARA